MLIGDSTSAVGRGVKGKDERRRPAVANPCRTLLVLLRSLDLILRTMVYFK